MTIWPKRLTGLEPLRGPMRKTDEQEQQTGKETIPGQPVQSPVQNVTLGNASGTVNSTNGVPYPPRCPRGDLDYYQDRGDSERLAGRSQRRCEAERHETEAPILA